MPLQANTQDITANYATFASFHSLSNSLIINPTIRSYIARATNSVFK